jgi:serine/threonine-protein kinase RsbW
MLGRLQLELPAAIDSIATATSAAADFLRARGASDSAIHFIQLAIDELLSNSVKYGFDHPPADAAIHIDLHITDDVATLEFSDPGRPFNPLDAPPPDLDAPIMERTPGGLGIHFLRHMSDGIAYARRDGKNIITLRKNLAA